MSNPWNREPREQTDEMLAILARQVFRRRDAGLDPLDFSLSPWKLSRKRAEQYMAEAEARGIITHKSEEAP